MLGWQHALDSISPFHETYAGAVEILANAEFSERGFIRQTISVEMVNRQPGLILVNERKRRTADAPAVTGQSLDNCPDEMRLAGPERAGQGDNGTGEQ